MSEREIDFMGMQNIIAYTQGVITFESRDLTRNPPMTDKKGQRKFQKQVKNELEDIWSTMYPSHRKITDEKYRKMMKFKERMEG